MNYELAKQLKDAGFSFQQKAYYAVNKDNTPVINAPLGTEGEDYLFVPDLSELIEACGDGFEWLGLYHASPYGFIEDKYFNKNKWVCGKWECGVPQEGDYFIEQSHGTTPEEAVANLYIALQNTTG